MLKGGASRNDLFDRIAGDPLFSIDRTTIDDLARPEAFIGLSLRQTERFIAEDVDPLLDRHRDLIDQTVSEVRV